MTLLLPQLASRTWAELCGIWRTSYKQKPILNKEIMFSCEVSLSAPHLFAVARYGKRTNGEAMEIFPCSFPWKKGRTNEIRFPKIFLKKSFSGAGVFVGAGFPCFP